MATRSDTEENSVSNPVQERKTSRFDYIFKIVIIGDATCGKTSLMKRYVDDEFHEQSLTTIGVDFKLKTISLDGSNIKLQIWDTAGQERFAPLGSLYYHGAHAVIVTYDISKRTTFDSIPRWCRKFEDRDTQGVDTVRVLVGCKSDLDNQREVNSSEGQTIAIETGARWAETSSKTGEHVEKLFDEIARAVLERVRVSVRQASDMSSVRSESLETGSEVLTPTVENMPDNSSKPFKVIKRLSVRPKSVRKILSQNSGENRNKNCCKTIS